MTARYRTLAASAALLCVFAQQASAAELVLADGGKSDYQIVAGDAGRLRCLGNAAERRDVSSRGWSATQPVAIQRWPLRGQGTVRRMPIFSTNASVRAKTSGSS